MHPIQWLDWRNLGLKYCASQDSDSYEHVVRSRCDRIRNIKTLR